METFKGKAIYNPSGKAGEYSAWACNFYTGCSNGCDYCYLKKGRGAKVLGGDVPVLKKCFKNEEHAIEVFEKELIHNLSELQKSGLFFSFTTDPFLDLTMDLTLFAMQKCLDNGVNVKVLTKNAENPLFAFIGYSGLTTIGGVMQNYFSDHRDMIAIGFTLTGFDERESSASLNIERVRAMTRLHNAGFKVWASIEPVIDIPKSLAMINLSNGSCDLYKVGLMSGERYSKSDLQAFIQMLVEMYPQNKFYFKGTLLKQAEIERESLPSNCVGRDYDIFKDKNRV